MAKTPIFCPYQTNQTKNEISTDFIKPLKSDLFYQFPLLLMFILLLKTPPTQPNHFV